MNEPLVHWTQAETAGVHRHHRYHGRVLICIRARVCAGQRFLARNTPQQNVADMVYIWVSRTSRAYDGIELLRADADAQAGPCRAAQTFGSEMLCSLVNLCPCSRFIPDCRKPSWQVLAIDGIPLSMHSIAESGSIGAQARGRAG